MLGIGYGCFVHFPEGARDRVLHQAKITATNGTLYTAECEAACIMAEADQHIMLFYNARRNFVQQPIRIVDVVQTEPCLLFTFQIAGEPVSAQNREFFRVSTAMSNLLVDVGPEADCQLIDVSMNGLSICAKNEFNVGRILLVRIEFEGKEYTGTARVQGARRLEDHRMRYGLLCIADALSGENLQAGLRQITMTMQRKQLKRLSRAT